MEDITVTPTETKVEKVEETLLTQKQVDEIVKERVLREKTKFAKDLGIGDEFDKSKYDEFKKYLESQKTEADKLAERNVELEAQINLAKQEARQVRIERELDGILKELDIDTKYAKTILKLTDLSSIEDISKENLKPVIENTINEELPMLVKSETIKVGAEPKETKVVSGVQDYLEKKYKNNPYYNK